MIESVRIRNFKSIKDLDLTLRPINLLIGPNGAGKSNYINFFNFIHAFYEGHLSVHTAERGGADRILHLGKRVSPVIQGELNFLDEDGYQFELGITNKDAFFFKNEAYWKHKGKLLIIPENEENLTKFESMFFLKSESNMTPLFKNFESFRVYHFHDTSKNAPLKQTARVADTRFLRADGSNLAAILYDFQQQHGRAFNLIEATVKQIAPYFEQFDLYPSGNGDYIRLNWRQKGSDMYLDAADFSDGTLRFIALATLLLQPEPPVTILIDEPELGLHPYAITILAGLMQSVSVKSQVIVSTQSVSLVNEFSPSDIIVVENRNNESTFRRLGESELTDWLNDYTLGDLWQKNVIGGNP